MNFYLVHDKVQDYTINLVLTYSTNQIVDDFILRLHLDPFSSLVSKLGVVDIHSNLGCIIFYSDFYLFTHKIYLGYKCANLAKTKKALNSNLRMPPHLVASLSPSFSIPWTLLSEFLFNSIKDIMHLFKVRICCSSCILNPLNNFLVRW